MTPRSDRDELARLREELAAARFDRGLLDACGDILAAVDLQGRITDVNAAAERALGYPRSELIGSESVSYFTEPDRAWSGLERVFSEGAIRDYPLELRHKDGRTTPVRCDAALYRDPGGQVTGVLATARDVTEVRRAETALRAAEEELKAIFDHAPAAIVEMAADGTILKVNKRTEEMLGLPADKIRGRRADDFVDPADRASEAEAVRELLAGRRAYQRVRRYPRADGSQGWVSVARAVARAQDGTPVRMISISRDVSPQQQAEAALRESEERLRAIVDNAPAGIDELTPDGAFVTANPRFFQIVGYTAEDLRSFPLSAIIHPDDQAADLAGTRRLVDGEISYYAMEKRFIQKDGSIVWAEVSRTLVRDGDGRPLRIVGVVRDITGQREAEAALSALNADLELRVQQRTADVELAKRNLEAFTYSVSHDLRAPLRALSGFSEALIEEYGDRLDQTGRGYAERVVAASERMSQLIDDLLVLSRMSRTNITPLPVDLSAEAAEIASDLAGRDPGRDVSVSIQPGVLVTADRELIRSVLQNLLDNAWKFTSGRAGAVVEFGAAAAQPGRVRCYVRDNGAGFDQAYADKLFQPFQRLHSVTAFPGTGIGLASVQRVIERHGGEVSAEGSVDRGATFYFTLDGPAPSPSEPPDDWPDNGCLSPVRHGEARHQRPPRGQPVLAAKASTMSNCASSSTTATIT